jgi:hypothetical protein
MYSFRYSGYSRNEVPGISPSINWIYFIGLRPLAFAVSIRVYIPALASAPLGLPENSQFLLLCSIAHKRKNCLFSDTLEGASANTLYLTIIEMAKAYDLNLYEYVKFLLENRPSEGMSDEEIAKLAPWNETVHNFARTKWSKMLAFPNPSNRIRK